MTNLQNIFHPQTLNVHNFKLNGYLQVLPDESHRCRKGKKKAAPCGTAFSL